MRKVLTGLLFLLFAYCAVAQDHTRKLTGVVKDDGTKGALSAVSVKVKNRKGGVVTDADGNFTLTIPVGSIVLEISSVGYTTKDVAVDDNTSNVEVTLVPDTKQMDAVVVTALGIRKSEKSVTYATQQISNSELTDVKTDNLMDALNGKVAGVTISPSSSGVGGSAKVILRGNRSASGVNQPLYVIDGIPISNTGNNVSLSSTNSTGGPNSTYGGTTNVDNGDGISNLNPDDIESMTVLEGAAAAALYGSQAANGVIVITTKKGKAGKTQINFSSQASMDKIAYQPKFQNEYGETPPATAGGAPGTTSWGAKISGARNNLPLFFQTGDNFTNSINLSGGNQVAQTYFSYANTTARGVEPGNKLSRNNFNFREVGHFLDDKLTVDANISYITQEIDNQPFAGLYFNPLTGLYLFPRGRDITPYKNNPQGPDTTNGVPWQNWPFNEDVQQNPWWIIRYNPSYAKRNRVIFNGIVKYDFTSWLSLQVRGNLDRTNDMFEQDLYAGTNPVNSQFNGQFLQSNQVVNQKYGDALLTFNIPHMTKFKIDGVLGTSITDASVTGVVIGPDANSNYTAPGLFIPNIFLTQNMVVAENGTAGSNAITQPVDHTQIQSVFGNLNFAYNNWAYLNLTGRADWSSNLAFTDHDSYFYPSAGLSIILSQLLHLPKGIDYLKLRGTYAQVGNTVPFYVTYPLTHIGLAGATTLNSTAPFPELKPEKTKSTELGADFRFLDNRLTASFTYYKSNTFNQFIALSPSVTSSYSKGYVNAGNIQNEGIEFTLGYDVIKNRNFTWNTAFNGSTNHNKIIDLDSKEGINQLVLTGNANNSYESVLATGGSFGDIYGTTPDVDSKGRVVVGTNGLPTQNTTFVKIGNPNPTFQLGWNNSFTYKRFYLNFLVDGKFGGQVLSMTQAMMDSYGVSKATGAARDAGGVKINGVNAAGEAVTTADPFTWYNAVGGRAGISSYYMYSATVVRLREAALGYTLPFKSGALKSLKFTLTGRNLLYFSKKAPYDPELTMSTGNGLSGVDVFNQPATRNFGFNVSVGL